MLSGRLVCALAAAAAGAIACVNPDGGNAMRHDESHTITEVDNGRTVAIAVGEAVVLCLPENATTGYRWTVEHLDPTLADIEEGNYRRFSDAVGSGGEACWTVHGKAPGTSQIGLKLWRHWEGDRSILKRFEFTLTVR